jgi:cytochrome c-type biogenesis protein
MTESWVGYLTGPWGFAFAFAAGVLSFLSPCVLPLVPAYLAHLTGTAATLDPDRNERRETVTHAVAFVFGFGAVFTALGASVGILSAAFGGDNAYFIHDHQHLLQQIGGVFLIILGLNLIGVIRIPFLYRTYTLETATQRAPAGATAGGGTMALGGGGGSFAVPGLVYAKSFGVGAAFAIGWTPCIGPVLGAITTLAATSGDAARGTYLLVFYSLGLGVPFVITAFAVVPITRFLKSIRGLMPIIEIATGVLVIFVGALLFMDELTIFNSYFSDIPGLDRFNNI